MLYFAYDGTIHGDWVSHYAIRLAAHDAGQQLHLLHVDEDHLAPSVLDGKLRQIEEECGRLNVKLLVEKCGRTADVFAALVARLPPTPEALVVCGTRTRQRRWSFLAGTVASRLMRTARYPVLAIHVVQPGLLGLPRDFLLPVAGHPRGLQAGLPFLRLFAPDVARVHLLHVRRVSRAQFRWLGHETAERLTREGSVYCRRIEQELADQLQLGHTVMDANVVVSDDVPKEIVIRANQVRARLIFMGASERKLSERFLYGSPIEQVLRDAPCDVAVYRGCT